MSAALFPHPENEPSLIAADPTRSAWVVANAGTGKTYTLANRVTRLLLADTPPEKILCLTYTKAAAAEMQARLFKQLGEWSMLPDVALSENIARIGAIPGGPAQLRAARRLFAKALETPGGLKVLTIHAFCQNVLSRFPLEADVPAGFDVLDEQTARDLLAGARRQVLERAARGDAALADAVALLVTESSENTLDSILRSAMSGDRRKLERFFETVTARGEDMPDAVRRAHGVGDDRDPDAIAHDFCASLKKDLARLSAIVEWLATGSEANARSAASLRDTLAMVPSQAMYVAYQSFLLTKDGTPRKSVAIKKLTDSRPDLAALLQTLQTELLACEMQRKAARCAALAQAALTLADAVRVAYTNAKQARGALDYEDLIVKTQVLLERGNAAAWVLYKLDGGLDHILIDEAQDTSPAQWRIVRALTNEFFSGHGKETDTTRTVFAVGDEKQSIFSFQGADPTQFDRYRARFIEAADAARQEFTVQPLITSRRSAPEILQFVDAVFAPEAAREGLTADKSVLHHAVHRKEVKGLVEVWPTTAYLPGEDPDPWGPPVDATPQNSPVNRLARQLAATIKDWIGKTTLPGHDKPVQAGDIMILLPKREPFGSAIIRELKQRGIPVAGADRIVVTEQIAVMDLIALGRFALMPDDDLTLATVLRSPLGGFSEDDLFAICHGRTGRLWAALSQRKAESAAFTAAHEFLSEVLRQADYAPPYEFFAHILVSLDMRMRLLARLGPEADDAIEEFHSLALSYERMNTPSLEGFLHWVSRGGAEIRRDMERGRDEVRVMTVHGAKGLEADIVILPDTARSPTKTGAGSGGLLYTEDGVLFPASKSDAPDCVAAAKAAAEQEALRENRRLFYVALTRARDRLYICGFETRRGVDPNSWYVLASDAAQRIGQPIARSDEPIFVVGDPQLHGQSAPSASLDTASQPLPGWLLTPPAQDGARPRLLRPSELLDGEVVSSPAGKSGAKRFQRGLLIHTLLAKLPEIAPDAREAAAHAYLQRRGVLDKDAVTLIEETLRVLNDPVFAPAFTPGSRAEVPLIAELPEFGAGVKVSGRIDRLAITPDEVLVVDFKTNRPPPRIETEVAQPYVRQMAIYRAALQKIFPERRVVCGLVWTEVPRLMMLSGALLDDALVRLMARPDAPVAA